MNSFSSSSHASTAQAGGGDNPTVLIVDDDDGVRLAVSRGLEKSGFNIHAASNGDEGLKLAERHRPDIVLSDVSMPGMNGLELLEELRVRQPRLPVILFTAYGDVSGAVRAMKSGARDFVAKPVSIDDLERSLRVVLAEDPRQQEEQAPSPTRSRSRRRDARQASKARSAAPPVFASSSMERVLDLARSIARSRAPVLLRGESGTGKEVLARTVHESSDRSDGPFVALNCAALPDTLLESELFGHEKGAFSGAETTRRGKFELADGGTLLLDEISEMAPNLQAKLLRVLQEYEVDRLGGDRPIPVDVRVVATTNRDLAAEVQRGSFRRDLYYRINVVPIDLPPLRERVADIGPMATHFATWHSERNGVEPRTLDASALKRLERYEWPGNVRQLTNTIERAVLTCGGTVISAEHLVFDEEADPAQGEGEIDFGSMTMKEIERTAILKALDECRQNRTRAAEKLGISVRTLRNKINEYRAQGFDIPTPGRDDDES